ncbi:hypothetical protein ACFC0R_24750 [Streptomyces sp. NPDC056086]|uniref:hypothetical protein n=1 Tax=Streptomyces sp. NPDC056086 TaxID=3345709 RepID=UPI0035DE0143
MTSTAAPEMRIAPVFHHACSRVSGGAFCFGGLFVFAAIRFSSARARSKTTGRNRGLPSSSTAVTYPRSSASRQAAI